MESPSQKMVVRLASLVANTTSRGASIDTAASGVCSCPSRSDALRSNEAIASFHASRFVVPPESAPSCEDCAPEGREDRLACCAVSSAIESHSPSRSGGACLPLQHRRSFTPAPRFAAFRCAANSLAASFAASSSARSASKRISTAVACLSTADATDFHQLAMFTSARFAPGLINTMSAGKRAAAIGATN